MTNLKGSIVPVVTPFKEDFSIDVEAMRKLVGWLADEGSHGICVCGSTGEATSLSIAERKMLYELAVNCLPGSIPVIAGVVSSSLNDTIDLARSASSAGCSALLVGVPYYSRPSQEGIFQYFARVCSVVDLPVIVYNIPSRSGSNMEPETLARLKREFSNLAGIKEANRDFEQMNRDILECGKDFLVFSGIESLCFPLMCVGGAGYFSATANILPRKLAELFNLCDAGRWDEARKLHYELLPLNIALFWETNPVPLKAALSLTGMIKEVLRPPLLPMNKDKKAELRRILERYGIKETDEER
ncbi:MAG: 4-hydroxy-tetrahydrodipicolinate synthase [Conexivisphaerales archaeon]